MATANYASYTPLTGFSPPGTLTYTTGITVSTGYIIDNETTVPTHSPGSENNLYVSDGDVMSATGNQVYSGYTLDGYPIMEDGGNYYVYHNGAAPTGSVTALNAFPLCFLKGTNILTTKGEVAVEDLQIGDQLILDTVTGRTEPVKFVFIDTFQHPFVVKEETYPICIKANALADNVPSRDLYVSPDHAIYFPEWKIFVEAQALRNDSSIYQVPTMPDTFTYYHVLCNNQEIVLAENTPAETFIDNVTMETFDNYAEYAALYPEDHFMEELDIPRGKSWQQLPRVFKQNLLDRAQMLYPVAQVA